MSHSDGFAGESADPHYQVVRLEHATLLRLTSPDNTNRLTRSRVAALTDAIERLAEEAAPKPLVIAGNEHFFSAGADLSEIRALTGPQAFVFAEIGQRLMRAIAGFPAPSIAAIEGYCMGGGLDLAMACHRRVASRHAIFGHRGAALGLMTGWGGTQRLPGLIGKGRAMQMFLAAEKLHTEEALRTGLVHFLSDDPVTYVTDVLVPSLRYGRGY